LPLYIDTIALLYNRDILDRNAVVAPPTTWTDVQKLVPTLVQKGSNGSVTRAAAAIGGSAQTIANAADLLSLIFFQYGISITDQGRVTFGAQGGEQALTFYTQFANPESPVYTWNDSRPSSVDSFAAGTTAMIFDYRETEKAVRAKNPFLPLMVAPVPQLLPQEPVTYARYYGLTVSNQSANPAWAWHAILSLTTLAQEARTYALTTDRLPVLRTLIGEYLSRTGFETYARQALTARSWSQPDNTQTTTILSEMIRRVIAGEQSVTDSLRQGAQRVSELAGTR
jgi:ABC-type glycerol-3-phosphate transport system substrate-binding protein